MKVKVTKVPASGKSSTTDVEVTAGATVADVLKAGRIDGKGMKVTINGEPATRKTVVAAGAEVRLTERAAGS